jgi:hypothetical protein
LIRSIDDGEHQQSRLIKRENIRHFGGSAAVEVTGSTFAHAATTHTDQLQKEQQAALDSPLLFGGIDDRCRSRWGTR